MAPAGTLCGMRGGARKCVEVRACRESARRWASIAAKMQEVKAGEGPQWPRFPSGINTRRPCTSISKTGAVRAFWMRARGGFYSNNSYRHIAFDGGAVEFAALPLGHAGGQVQHGAVVPEQQIVRLPVVAIHKLRLRAVRKQLGQQRV